MRESPSAGPQSPSASPLTRGPVRLEVGAALRVARGAWIAAGSGYMIAAALGASTSGTGWTGALIGPLLWLLALIALIAATTDLVGGDLRSGAALYWIQRRGTGTGFYLRRLAARVGLYLALLGAILLLLVLVGRSGGTGMAAAQMHAVVAISVAPLFASVFLLSCAGVRHEAAAGLAHALILSPPMLAAGEGASLPVAGLIQMLAYPWVQLDVVASAIVSGGTPRPLEVAIILAWVSGWVAVGSWLLARRLSRYRGLAPGPRSQGGRR